jgi:flavin reductase (DIM6/NTAB) family NADH-FMN oxidoreductase RutF
VPTSVTIVTTYVDLRPWGQTVSAFASVSADPPTVLVCINRRTATCASLESSGAFGVSFLADTQRHVAEAGAAAGTPKFLEQYTPEERSGYSPEYGLSVGSIESAPARQYYASQSPVTSPVVHGAYCHLDCSIARIVDVGTHAVVIGAVEAIIDGEGDQLPLIYHDRAFHALGDKVQREPRARPVLRQNRDLPTAPVAVTSTPKPSTRQPLRVAAATH